MPEPKDPKKYKLWRKRLLARPKPTPESNRKRSLALKGRVFSKEHRKKLSEARKGRKHSLEARKKMSESMKGRVPWNRGYGDYMKGEKNPLYGVGHTEETKRKIREIAKNNPNYGMRGKKLTEEAKEKIRESKLGEKNPAFSNWISREPYGKEWSPELKKCIRERDKNKCYICNKKVKVGSVHHINYIKQDLMPINLITLCQSCHSATSHKRDYWFAYFCHQLKIEPEELLK